MTGGRIEDGTSTKQVLAVKIRRHDTPTTTVGGMWAGEHDTGKNAVMPRQDGCRYRVGKDIECIVSTWREIKVQTIGIDRSHHNTWGYRRRKRLLLYCGD